MIIDKNTVVTLRYIMRNAGGDLMEDNTAATPITYLHGSGRLLPALEAEMAGLSAGDKKNFSVHDEQLHGEFSFEVFVDEVRPASTTEIIAGKPECGPDCVC